MQSPQSDQWQEIHDLLKAFPCTVYSYPSYFHGFIIIFLITSHLVSNIFKYEHHHRWTVNFHHAFFHLAALCISLVLLTVMHAKKQEFPCFHLQLLLKSSLPIIFAIHLSLKHESSSEFQCQKWRCWRSIR